MIIYRPHRGSLKDALKEAKEFDSIDEMKQYIYNDWKKLYLELNYKDAPFEVEDILIDNESIEDKRCGWHDTRYVCIKRMWEENYNIPQCIGMCATNYER